MRKGFNEYCKRINYSYYSHKDSPFWYGVRAVHLSNIEKTYPDLYKRLMKICEIIRFDDTYVNKKMVFVEFFDFDKELNPVIKAWYTFEADGARNWVYKGRRENSKKNPLILHKKELMVGHSYEGFNQGLSEEWTKLYSESHIWEFKESSKIGRKLYWDNCLEKLKTKYKEEYEDFMQRWDNQWK